MKNRMKISDDYTNGAQPSKEELQRLADEGFKTVINLRTPGEEDQPLSPDEEGDIVRRLGMDYFQMPVSTTDMKPEQVDDYYQRFDHLARPVFGHCKSGKRSGAFYMMSEARRKGWTGQETLDKAEQLGFECDKPELREFVKNYVDSRVHAAGA